MREDNSKLPMPGDMLLFEAKYCQPCDFIIGNLQRFFDGRAGHVATIVHYFKETNTVLVFDALMSGLAFREYDWNEKSKALIRPHGLTLETAQVEDKLVEYFQGITDKRYPIDELIEVGVKAFLRRTLLGMVIPRGIPSNSNRMICSALAHQAMLHLIPEFTCTVGRGSLTPEETTPNDLYFCKETYTVKDWDVIL